MRLLAVAVLLAGCAAERVDWRDIRVLKTAGADVTGCTFRGLSQDDDMEDLLKKAGKIYGDTVVMKDTMGAKDLVAEVYRCRAEGKR